MASSYYIGVDGGGTKTELILLDDTGATLATHVAPGCNPSQIGPEQARTALHDALAALLVGSKTKIQNSKISRTLLCMAGAPAFWQETAAALRGYGRVETVKDSAPVLELATAGNPGLALHAGTGSFVAARALDGALRYAGGLGWKLGDAGSGFDLGRRAIALALLELQSRSASRDDVPSALALALRQHTGLDDYAGNSRFFYNDPNANAVIAAFAPRVLELAERDCTAAQQVVADSVTELARLADQVIRNLFSAATSPVPCGVSGRILNAAPAASTLRTLAAQFRWPVELNFLTTPPIEGVKRLLLANR